MARTKNSTGTALLSDSNRIRVGKLINWRCPCCSRKVNRSRCKKSQLQIDHWVADNNGGGASANLVPLCGTCNAIKSDRADHLGWIAEALAKQAGHKTTRASRKVAPAVLVSLTETLDAVTALLNDAA